MTGRDPTERGHVVSSPVSPTTESAEVAGTFVAQASERAIPEGNRRDSVEQTRSDLELLADALTLPSEGATKYTTPQCCGCHRFVNVATAYQHVEYGDYGTVLSVEYECRRCAGEAA